MKAFRFQAVTTVLVSLYASAVPARPAVLMGELEQTVTDTYRLGDDLDPCELNLAQKNLRLALARAIDDRAKEFADYNRSLSRNGRFTTAAELNIGPLSLTPRLSPTPSDKKPNKEGWVSFRSGWADFEKEYQEVRGQRVNARWSRLSNTIRATVADDYRRAVRRVWMGVSAEGVAEAPVLANTIETCLTQKKCDDLQKPEPFRNALNLSPNSKSDYESYRKASTEVSRERALKNLLAEVKPFLAYFEPVKQKGVRISDGNTFIISLDAADFRGYETDLGLIIEKFWKVGDDALKIEWMTSTRDEPLFRFYFNPAPKSGSQVDFLRRTITLGQGAVESIPAHEVGRALGFRARYFSVWHPETCQYDDQSKPIDLLSDGRSGSVAPEHWAALKKAYAPRP